MDHSSLSLEFLGMDKAEPNLKTFFEELLEYASVKTVPRMEIYELSTLGLKVVVFDKKVSNFVFYGPFDECRPKDFQPYTDILPFGLKFGEPAQWVQSRLGIPIITRSVLLSELFFESALSSSLSLDFDLTAETYLVDIGKALETVYAPNTSLLAAVRTKLINRHQTTQLLLQNKQFDKALPLLLQELKVQPEGLCLIELAQCYEKLNQFVEAEHFYSRALNSELLMTALPEHVIDSYANFLEAQGRYSEAIDKLNILVELHKSTRSSNYKTTRARLNRLIKLAKS